MKLTSTYRICLLLILNGLGLFPFALRGQDCFSVDVAKSKVILTPNGETTIPENGDTLLLPCTKAVKNFSFQIDFKANTEKFFEDSTQFQGTLMHKSTTYLLIYDKDANTFSLPASAPILYDSAFTLTVSSIMCPQTPPVCDNCTITYSFHIVYQNDPDFSVDIHTDPSPAVLTCLPGSVVTLEAAPPPHNLFTGQWSRLINLQYVAIAGATDLSYTTDDSGTYLYTQKGPAGCSASNFVAVSPPSRPEIILSQQELPLQACSQVISGVSVGNSGPPANLELGWTTAGSGILVSGQTSLEPVIAALGDYTLVVKRLDNGCADTATVTVVPGVIPTVIVQIAGASGSELLDCRTTSIKLRATASLSNGGNSAYTYIWADGTPGDELTVSAPGIYSVTATSTDIGCQGAADISVFQDISVPGLQIIRPRDTVCAGESVLLTAFSQETVTYLWQTNATTSSITALPGQTGPNPYTVTVTANDNGCTNAVTVQIERLDPPSLSCLQNDLTVPNGSLITLDCPHTGAQLIWLAVASNVRNIPPSGEDAIQNRTMNLTAPQAPGTVHFAFYAKNAGCTSDRADVTVTVLPESPDGIFVPELVTPNGDGLNDTWGISWPSSLSNPDAFQISVFDRHGAVVYEGALSTPVRAETYPDGAYYYVISKPDGSRIRGAVTILRRN